jgi:hypothetical protein
MVAGRIFLHHHRRICSISSYRVHIINLPHDPLRPLNRSRHYEPVANRAHNPPCAVTPYATCPLAPKENRLAVAIPAGEKYNHKLGH